MNQPFSYDHILDDLDMNLDLKHIMGLMMQDEAEKKDGNIYTDTSGAEYFFIHGFVTDSMHFDFDAIEADFFKHCSDKLGLFAEVQRYFYHSCAASSPDEAHEYTVLGAVLNGAKIGDPYCKALIIYLFKTYYRKEYGQLKRFRSISAQELAGLAKDEHDGIRLSMLGILIVLCSQMDIRLTENCSIWYRYLTKKKLEEEEETEAIYDSSGIDKDLYAKCLETVSVWYNRDRDKNGSNSNKVFWREDKLVSRILQRCGYPEDYVFSALSNGEKFLYRYARTLAALRSAFPQKDFSYEDVQKYAHLYNALEALTDVSYKLDFVNEMVFESQALSEEAYESFLFEPKKIIVPSGKTGNENNIPPVSVYAGKENKQEAVNTDSLLSEMENLRSRLNRMEYAYHKLKAQYASVNTARKEAEALLSGYQEDREELIALRDFVYNLESEIPKVTKLSTEEMKTVIAQKKYLIVGGHINWVNKLKSEFPTWSFVIPGSTNTVDESIVMNKDRIFFFTDHLGHSTYNRFIALAREKNIPFSYIHGVNMDQVIYRIYESDSD